MKKSFLAACLIAMAIVSCTSNESKKDDSTTVADTGITASADTSAGTPPPPMDSATMMNNWMAYATPGDMHKLMSSWDGTWDATVTSYYPGKAPEVSKSTTVNTTIMDGRYQRSVHKGTMMGAPFNGESIMGYDNARKKFISTWVDNMGTGVMLMEGTWDAGSKKLNLSGQCVDPSAGTDKMMNIKQVISVIDDKTQMFEMYGPGPDGKEFKMMDIKLTKK
jgi:hypothetical protein